MVCERSKSELNNFECPYKERIDCPEKCELQMGAEKMEEVQSSVILVSPYGSKKG